MNALATDEFERPAFQSLDVGELPEAGLSKLAVIALVLGLASLLAILTQNLLLLSVVATCVGIVAMCVLLRSTELRGLRLAQAGLALGVVSGTWTVAANNGTDDYLYETAGVHAAAFLEVLSQGRIYEALELTKGESNRQIAGTDLEQYYGSLNEEDAAARDDFLHNPSVEAAIAAGPSADWSLKQGIAVNGSAMSFEIEVEMVNAADAAASPIRVRMRRTRGLLVDDQGLPTALWHVDDLRSP